MIPVQVRTYDEPSNTESFIPGFLDLNEIALISKYDNRDDLSEVLLKSGECIIIRMNFKTLNDLIQNEQKSFTHFIYHKETTEN